MRQAVLVQFMKTDAQALAAFYDAFDRADAVSGREFETYYDREDDSVDGHGSEVVEALLAAGWTPPPASPGWVVSEPIRQS